MTGTKYAQRINAALLFVERPDPEHPDTQQLYTRGFRKINDQLEIVKTDDLEKAAKTVTSLNLDQPFNPKNANDVFEGMMNHPLAGSEPFNEDDRASFTKLLKKQCLVRTLMVFDVMSNKKPTDKPTVTIDGNQYFVDPEKFHRPI